MEKNKKLVIIGTGEIGILAYEYFNHDSKYTVVAFSVSEKYVQNPTFLDLPVIPFEILEQRYSPEDFEVFVALGSGRLNRDRMKMYFEAKAKGYHLASYISSRAFVWHNVKIGENCFIMEDNTLQPFTEIGNNVVLWSGNHIGHRSIIRDHCFISSHVVISGFCEIGESCFIGVNASIGDNRKVARDNFIAMASSLNKNTKEDRLYSGNPAKDMHFSVREYFGADKE